MAIQKTVRWWTPTRLALTILVFTLLAALGVSSCNSSDERRNNPAGPTVSSAPRPASPRSPVAPPPVVSLPASITEAELKAVSGEPIKLANYSGKVLLVNLWATWCGPCRLETPELVKLHKEFRSQGVEIVGLSTEDPKESEADVRQFVHNYNIDYRVGWSGQDVAIALMQGRDAIPQSFIISRDGKILKRFVGFNPSATPPQIREALQEALNAKTATD